MTIYEKEYLTKLVNIDIVKSGKTGGDLDMLITKETDYALRILRSLSCEECLTVGELSARESLPQKFAYKIVKKLERAGLIRILRGVNGGCSLDADLRTVSLYDLSVAMEEKVQISSCMSSSYECDWRQAHGGMCTIHVQLSKIQRAVDREFGSRSLHWIMFGED